MELKSHFENSSHALRSSLDPPSMNEVEILKPGPEECSDDFEADLSLPDSIDPELINTPGLNPEDEEDLPGGVDPGLDPKELPDSVKPGDDLTTPDEARRKGP